MIPRIYYKIRNPGPSRLLNCFRKVKVNGFWMKMFSYSFKMCLFPLLCQMLCLVLRRQVQRECVLKPQCAVCRETVTPASHEKVCYLLHLSWHRGAFQADESGCFSGRPGNAVEVAGGRARKDRSSELSVEDSHTFCFQTMPPTSGFFNSKKKNNKVSKCIAQFCETQCVCMNVTWIYKHMHIFTYTHWIMIENIVLYCDFKKYLKVTSANEPLWASMSS